MSKWMERNLPEFTKSWRRARYSWRMLRAERLLGRAGDQYAKAGELNLALEAYDLAVKSGSSGSDQSQPSKDNHNGG